MKKSIKLYATFTAMALTAMLAFAGCDNTVGYENYANAESYVVGAASFSNAQVKKVEIDWLAGSVDVEQAATEEIQVVESESNLEDAKRMRYYLDGDVLRVKYCQSGWRGSILEQNKNLRVVIPAGTALEIDSTSAVVTAVGTIEVTDFSVDTVSGNVTAERIVCNDADVETVSGKISIGSLQTNSCSVDTVSGDCNVGLTASFLEADTTSGNLTFLLQAATKAEVESTSGNVTFTVGELGGRVAFETRSGSFRSDKQYTQTGTRYDVVGGDGTAVGFTIEVDSVSGNLYIQ